MERKIQGQNVTEDQIDAWVAEAEEGYDATWLKNRMGRPTRGGHAARVVPVRLTEDELKAVMARADREHLNRSEAIRQALAEWAAFSGHGLASSGDRAGDKDGGRFVSDPGGTIDPTATGGTT